jgi:uncharacterized protein YukJ
MAIKHLLLKDWIVNLQRTLYEGNIAADFMSKRGALSDSNVIFHEATNWYGIFPLNVWHEH